MRRVEILDWRWTRPEEPSSVAAQLRGVVVDRVGRAGKYLDLSLSSGAHLLIHLRMTGSLLFDPTDEPTRHTRVRLHLDQGHRLLYIDPRRFGTGHVVADDAERDAYLAARLGAEPFTPAFTATYLRQAARGRRAPIKAFLLDQRRIAGVGNIYADEALFRAGVHPLRPAGKLTTTQWTRLHEAIEEVLSAGIDARGATIDDFRHVDGARGSFQDRFLIHLRGGASHKSLRPAAARCARSWPPDGGPTSMRAGRQPRPSAPPPSPGPRVSPVGYKRGPEVAQPTLAIRGEELVEAAERFPSITIWGKENIPCLTLEPGPAVRIACQIDLLILDTAPLQESLGAGAEGTAVGRVNGDDSHRFKKYSPEIVSPADPRFTAAAVWLMARPPQDRGHRAALDPLRRGRSDPFPCVHA